MLFGEMTITLDDVSAIFHLPIRGSFFLPPVMDVDIVISYLQQLMGCTQAEACLEVHHMRGAHMSLAWLEELYDARRTSGD